MTDTYERPKRWRRALPRSRRGRITAIGAAVLVLAGTSIGTAAAETWPWPKDRYCWGAWEKDSGPGFLGDEALGEDGNGSRTVKETTPTVKRPTGRCDVLISADDTHSWDDGKVSVEQRVSVRYGPVPKSAETRLRMLQDRHLHGGKVPLPDGLPGTVDWEGGLLVLPKSCDAEDGRPTVVTVEASGKRTEGSKPARQDSADLASTVREASMLLTAVANRGMQAAGCAPAEPLEVRSPVYDLPGEPLPVDRFARELCGIQGLDLGEKKMEQQISAAPRDLLTCSVRTEDEETQLSLATITQPRLVTLFDGITGERPAARGWRGTGTIGEQRAFVRADCAGRPAVFLMGASVTPGRFATFTDVATARLGCAPVAPKGEAK